MITTIASGAPQGDGATHGMPSRASRRSASIEEAPAGDSGGTVFKCKDSSDSKCTGGNFFSEVGTWILP